MLDDDDLGRRLHSFMDREVSRSRPVDIEEVHARGSQRRRLNRFAIAAVVATLLAVIAGTFAVVARGPDGDRVSSVSDSRVRILILPGSGNDWVAFVVQNNMHVHVGYGPTGMVDRQRGSSWTQVGYFGNLSIGGTRPGTVTRDRPSAVPMVELGAEPGGLGAVRWIDVSSLSPGTYRVRQTIDWSDESSPATGSYLSATGVFRIVDRAQAQPRPEASVARIEPDPRVVNGAPMSLGLRLLGGTGDLAADTRIEQSVSLTVHVRRWEHGEWVEIAARQAVRVQNITSTVSLPRLSRGLYQLARAKPSGSEIKGWLFVTNAVAPLDNAATFKRCAASDSLSADLDGDHQPDRVYLVWGASDSGARLGACTTTGRSDEVSCAGQAEALLVVPMPAPQLPVIMCGGTSVSAVEYSGYVWSANTLRPARLPNGDGIGFLSGRTGGLEFVQFGCPRIGGERRLAQLTLTPRGAEWTWTRLGYSITAAGARLVDTQSGTVPGALTRRFIDAEVPPCGTISAGTEPRLTTMMLSSR
jgi:hypothetical protein